MLTLVLLLLMFGQAPGGSDQASPATADTPQAHLGKGYDALKQERYSVAATEFRAALRLDPKLVMRAQFPLGVALFEMKQSAEARSEFELVRRETGDHPNILYYLGRLDLMDENFEGAIRNLNKVVSQPPFPDTAYYLGLAYFKQGDLIEAEKWLKQAEQIQPDSSNVPYQLSQVYQKQGRNDEAKKAAALSAELRQRDASESQSKMECGKRLGEASFTEARAVCEPLNDPSNPEKLTALGTLYGQHGYLEQALEPLRRAAELAPHSPQMQYNLAYTYYKLRRFEEARAPISAAAERWPDLFPLNALYGAVLFELGEEAGAYQALHRAHELNKQDAPTSTLLFRAELALARRGENNHEYADSIRYFQEAAALRIDDPEPHRGLAEIYRLTGHLTEADAERRQAEQLANKETGRMQ